MASYNGRNMPDERKIDLSTNKKSKKTNWGALKQEWISTNVSLNGLAQKYELNTYTVLNHYRKENWAWELKKFNKFIDEKYDEALLAKAKDFAERASQLDSVVLNASEKIANILEFKIDQIVNNEDKLVHSELEDLAKTLKAASKALMNTHHNIRLASNRSTEITEINDNTDVDKKIKAYLDEEDVDHLIEEHE